MSKTKQKSHIVIYLQGGCIQEIASTQDIEVSVVDYDQAEVGEECFTEDYPVEITRNPLKEYNQWRKENPDETN